MKSVLYFAGIFIALIGCKPKQEGSSITFTSTTLSNEKITVRAIDLDSAVAQGTLSNGKITLAFQLPYPQLIAIEIDGLEQPIAFFADLTPMNIEYTPGSQPPFVITGSVYNDSLEYFGQKQNENRNYMQMLQSMWGEAVAANDEATQALIMQKADSANTSLEEFTNTFAARNGILGALIVDRFMYAPDINTLQKVYDQIPARFSSAKTVVSLKERKDILENTQIGKRFTDITQNDTTGAPLSISSIQAKYLLIDFWASWCGPCRIANPDLVKLYRDFHAQGFDIVGVSLDNKADAWKAAIVQDTLTWHQMSDLQGWGNAGAAAYGVRSIPQSVLLDSQGFIVHKNLSPVEIRAFLEKNL